MNTPLLAPIPPVADSNDALASSLAGGEAVVAFRVLSPGAFQGRTFRPGDVILCRGEPRSGDAVVLVARHGRPRLGVVRGTALLGDCGERCHPERWTPAGRMVAVMRQGAGGEVAELVEAGVGSQPAGSPPAVRRPARALPPVRRASPQLSLFAA